MGIVLAVKPRLRRIRLAWCCNPCWQELANGPTRETPANSTTSSMNTSQNVHILEEDVRATTRCAITALEEGKSAKRARETIDVDSC